MVATTSLRTAFALSLATSALLLIFFFTTNKNHGLERGLVMSQRTTAPCSTVFGMKSRPAFRNFRVHADEEGASVEGDAAYSPEFIKRVKKALKIKEKDWTMEKLTDPKQRIDTLVQFSKKRDFDPMVLQHLLSAFKESGMETKEEVRKETLEYLRFSRARKRIMDRQLAELFPEAA
mmetsp:Transcript_29284/g.47571  ORF Transcript_29284/g.47571 Transcript_29284/m.47571 type:complete len:177 (-) Transcript_29284:294-824(-)